ncbi:hypothetical protein [Photorhabdus bodei]|uniref:Uncharacterized protein n=1 Tax=Photorhabdus bodei TaxID=2029681 RepID=A0AAW6BKC0_9GAMM|nr:hypothetical protein [Photorhabdus bodei]MDB6373877.1 hypothetical protein [Photorhabdus bodei]
MENENNTIELKMWLKHAQFTFSRTGCPYDRVNDTLLTSAMLVARQSEMHPERLETLLESIATDFPGYDFMRCRFNQSLFPHFVMKHEMLVMIGGLTEYLIDGIMLAALCHMRQLRTLSELLTLIPNGMPERNVLKELWQSQKTDAGCNLLDNFDLIDAIASEQHARGQQ